MAENACSQQHGLPPSSCSSGYRMNQIKEATLDSPNKALAALVESAGSSVGKQRRLERSKAVLPVRISGNDISGEPYSELVHTLDVSRTGVRLGAVRRQLEVGSLVDPSVSTTQGRVPSGLDQAAPFRPRTTGWSGSWRTKRPVGPRYQCHESTPRRQYQRPAVALPWEHEASSVEVKTNRPLQNYSTAAT